MMNRAMHAILLSRHIIMGAMLFAAIFADGAILAQTTESSNSRMISKRARPLEDAAVLLQAEYGMPITYEDPILIWREDLESVQYAKGKTGLQPKPLSFSMPVDVDPGRNPKLDDWLLGKVLDAYHRQTDGPRFRVTDWSWGLSILPAEVRDANGQLAKVTPLLDTIISIPEAVRSPSEHFGAICEAITTSTGIELKYGGQWMDQYFSPIPLPRRMNDDQRKQISFTWGGVNLIAREAVINLLEHSATTLTWKVLCQSDEGYCVFTPQPIMINARSSDGTLAGRKALTRDRK